MAAGAGFVLILRVIADMGGDQTPAAALPPAIPRPAMHLRVQFDFAAIDVTVRGDRPTPGEELIIYLNGTPGWDAWKATFRAGPKQVPVTIPLDRFVRSGQRFDPRTQAVDKIWVGNDVYGYAAFGR